MKRYLVAGKQWASLEEACKYASFIFKVSGLIVAVEEVKQ